MTFDRLALFVLACAVAPQASAALAKVEQCQSVTIVGKVKNPDLFERHLGMELSFKLFPDRSLGKGWTYQIGPATAAANEWTNYVAITPPYHFDDPSYIGPGWGRRAQDTARPRAWTFWFLASRRQSAAASVALDSYIWPSSGRPDREASAAILDGFDIGKGQFRIRSSPIRNGTALPGDMSGEADYGSVLGLSFDVQLVLPANFRVDPTLRPVPAECPKKGEWRR